LKKANLPKGWDAKPRGLKPVGYDSPAARFLFFAFYTKERRMITWQKNSGKE
jgi:hypothetical protein